MQVHHDEGVANRIDPSHAQIGHINLAAKRTGERKAGNPHVAFDVAGTGNVARSR